MALWTGHFQGGQLDQLAIAELHLAIGGLAETTRAPGNDLEHWLGVGLSLADGPQYLTGGRLPGDGLRQLGIARLQFLEQPHVLDGDDGLVGEGLEECDLALREGPRRAAADGNDADHRSVTQHRDTKAAPETGRVGQVGVGVLRVVQDRRMVNDRPCEDDPATGEAAVRRPRVHAPHSLGTRGIEVR